MKTIIVSDCISLQAKKIYENINRYAKEKTVVVSTSEAKKELLGIKG